jgi:hypothetical protein
MSELIVAFRKFANAPKNIRFSVTNIRTNWRGAQIMHKVSNKCLLVEKESGEVKKVQYMFLEDYVMFGTFFVLFND